MADVVVMSFGFGHGPAPEAHVVVDLRHHFRDPHVNPRLREMTAQDRLVRRAVLGTPGIKPLLKALVAQVQAFRRGPSAGVVTVAFGCVGGRHRSAVAAHVLARRLRRRGLDVELVHRDARRPVLVRSSSLESNCLIAHDSIKGDLSEDRGVDVGDRGCEWLRHGVGQRANGC